MTGTDLEKIQNFRDHWHQKLYEQIDELLLLSLAGDSQAYKRKQEDIETTMIIIWRFDRKMMHALDETNAE